MPVVAAEGPSRRAWRFSIPGPRSRTRITRLGGGLGLDQELHRPSARILEGVAGDLTRRGRDPGLVERGEAQKAGDLAGALPGQDDVAFQADFQGEDPHVHRGD